MPRLVNLTPKYRRHRHSGQAIVTFNGRDHYLGPYGTKASRAEYDRLIAEWLAVGRRPPESIAGNPATIVELAAAYWGFAQGYYRKNGQPTRTLERVKMSLRILKDSYAEILAADFGPLALQAIRVGLVNQGKARKYVNTLVEQIKRCFKWGVAQEIVPAAVFHGLSTVEGLRRGRTDAPESEPIGPVASSVVDATLLHLPPVVADMVRIQSLTGCRPGEICMLRPCDLDRSGDVWAFRPRSHKTEHHGRGRVIFVGPQAQEILRPYLLRDAGAYCFTPADSERRRLEARHELRKTAMSCGNRPGSNRRRRPKRFPRDHYDTGAYANCIRRAADLADRRAHDTDKPIAVGERIVPRWTPNQLRHGLATNLRKKFGLEAVQVVLGHARADVSQIYAERDMGLAERIMREVG